MLRDEFIVDVWERIGKEIVGAAELRLIQDEVAERFGSVSPAYIARVLADNGARLGHPEILQADVRWRDGNLFWSTEDLTIDTLDDATALMDKIESLRGHGEKQLYQQVRQLKSELDLMPTPLGQELAQWLAIWLQNPQIFGEWLALRRRTAEFRERFES